MEGVYGYGGSYDEPSIKPMLDLLSQWEYWPHVYERCRVKKQMELFLVDRWAQSNYGSVLYFATHGQPGRISLRADAASIPLEDLGRTDALSGQCVGCHVHFSACNVLEDESAVRYFLRETGAVAASGYRTAVGWAESSRPAVPLDLMLFNQLWERDVDFSNARSFKPKLRKIEEDLQRRFGDSEFKIVLSE